MARRRDLEVHRTGDAVAFARMAAPRITAVPVVHTVMATTLAHALEAPEDYPDASWFWVLDRGRIAALAMHAPPRPLHIATTDRDMAWALAGEVMRGGDTVTLVSGLVEGALAFSESLAYDGGQHIRVVRREGMHDLPGPARLPAGIPGALRPAIESDIDLVTAWARGYVTESRETEPNPRLIRRWVQRGQLGLWVDGDRPVSMANASRPHGGVSRISLVYTPPEFRGRGYGAACVAEVSRRQKAKGHRCLLYTDLDSPASTSLYQTVGYRQIGTSCVLRLDEVGTNDGRRITTHGLADYTAPEL